MSIRHIAKYTDLAGKTVFITGGASGIGADIVRAFHGQSASVFFVDLDETAGRELCRALSDETGRAPSFEVCNVADETALQEAIDRAVIESGRLDVVVLNAANDTRQDATTVTGADWNASVAVNLKHQFFGATAAFRHMKDRTGGSIITFGSVAPRVGVKDLAVYSTCKSAVQGMTRSLARDFGPSGVRVNAIIPGAVMTERQRRLWITDEIEQENLDAQCLKRTLVGDDIAQMALFLGSDVSWGCTSQGFIVDAGIVG
ncbi:SDR family oxidoreductase [Rhodospirillaceae bacterium KN72]|uniref:SDR family oxidoreductase n=1 Tax=Pacificispira spongiicola TaxID=2729598 RepID=A0A7Y0DXZ8_9PROT|nr:SDR family oxidoreductase [Pacificispira spongiicola]NMM43677.1 SDR family oxidoreductase [Pacificispira spongiicola]